MAETLRRTVKTGEHASISEILREALQDYTRTRDAELRELDELRAAIRAGLDSGKGLPTEEVFAELRIRYTAES